VTPSPHGASGPQEEEIERFLLDYPAGIRAKAEALQEVVRLAAPDAIARLRPGWRLIGFDLPTARGLRYFAYVAPEPEHVHLGFEHGTLLADPHRLLHGAHLRLRKVRYLTYRPADRIPQRRVLGLVRDAATIAQLSAADLRALRAQATSERD
jgi:hypothetical protein